MRAKNGDRACDRYNQLEEGLDLIAGLGVAVYRCSTSRALDELLKRGIKNAATLYHWERPTPLADLV